MQAVKQLECLKNRYLKNKYATLSIWRDLSCSITHSFGNSSSSRFPLFQDFLGKIPAYLSLVWLPPHPPTKFIKPFIPTLKLCEHKCEIPKSNSEFSSCKTLTIQLCSRIVFWNVVFFLLLTPVAGQFQDLDFLMLRHISVHIHLLLGQHCAMTSNNSSFTRELTNLCMDANQIPHSLSSNEYFLKIYPCKNGCSVHFLCFFAYCDRLLPGCFSDHFLWINYCTRTSCY